MKKIILATIVLAAFVFAGCTATREEKTNTNAGTNSNTANVNKIEETKPAETNTSTSSSSAAMDSPTATLNTFIEAIKKKDGDTIKKCLSKSSLKALEDNAKEANMTVDQMIIEGDDMSKEKTPTFRNEKIEGDSATLEVEDEKSKKWDTIPFVKEDGNWKIAFDKMKT